MKESIIVVNPDIMSGEPVFRGTRVPIQTLFDYLTHNSTIDEFLIGFPHITREAVVAVLAEVAKRGIPRRIQKKQNAITSTT
ncbi:MAG: DUF433 domain-containing protein [Spirosomataceae bacterium]